MPFSEAFSLVRLMLLIFIHFTMRATRAQNCVSWEQKRRCVWAKNKLSEISQPYQTFLPQFHAKVRLLQLFVPFSLPPLPMPAPVSSSKLKTCTTMIGSFYPRRSQQVNKWHIPTLWWYLLREFPRSLYHQIVESPNCKYLAVMSIETKSV